MPLRSVVFPFVKAVAKEFASDECPRMAAAMAYYAIFSLPPLLALVIAIAGFVYGEQAVRGKLENEIERFIGPQASVQIQTMIEKAQQARTIEPAAMVVGIGALLFGATAAFAQLQGALNRVWGVKPSPRRSGFVVLILKRLLSFGMILAIAFLLLVSLVLSAVLSAVGQTVGGSLPSWISERLLWALNMLVSFGVVLVLFAAIFQFLPDAKIRWRDVWAGALFTSVLFVAGKFLIGYYIGRVDIGNAYGAAGSLALVLVWLYYSSLILFLGAEFTQVWAQFVGQPIQPSAGAVETGKNSVPAPKPSG